jgi:hypothetical protein
MTVVTEGNGDECGYFILMNGRYFNDGTDDNRDLVNIPRTIKVERWMNVYEDGAGTQVYEDKETADKHADTDRIACKHIVFEVFEGEGL